MSRSDLPAPRTPGRYHVELVCLGNICRSPTAAAVLERRLGGAGLGDRITVTSSGTGDWHVGGPMDERAAAVLTEAGYDATRHRARQLEPSGPADLLLAMDAGNRAEVLSRGADPQRVLAFRDFDPEGPGDVPDPYAGGPEGFTEVLTQVERTVEVLVGRLGDVVGRAA